MKIGLYDHYLDEWHANNYPALLRSEAKNKEIEIELYGFADIDKPDGMTNHEWSKKTGCHLCQSVEELVNICDAFIILAPSYPQFHERMIDQVIKAGSPIYVDKIFAPSFASAKRIFEKAQKFDIPLFTSSALRFADEIQEIKRHIEQIGNSIQWVATTGPNSFSVYAIHQIEMIQTVTQCRPQKVKAIRNNGGRNLIFEFNEKIASMLQMDAFPFQLAASSSQSCIHRKIESSFFNNLVREMLGFFITGDSPVKEEDTLDVMSMLWSSYKAMEEPDEWIVL